ncbi:MAG: phosphate/phosphite/phosphonate ABC transporter substrate-binding protein [Microcella sp.]
MKNLSRWGALGAASVLALGLAGCATDAPADDPTTAPAPEVDASADWPDELVIGLVPSQDLDQLVEDAEALGELLAAEIGIPVTTTVTDNYAALVVAMQTGQAQVGLFGPIALVAAADQAGAEVVLQSVRRGTASYHTQWFTTDTDRFCLDAPVIVTDDDGNEFSHCNGTDTAEAGPVGVEALANIESGETISFVDELSASGYYYPATQLENAAGLDPFSDISALFAGGHPNSILAVQRGDAAVGVSFDDARINLLDEDPDAGTSVTVFAWSDEIPNDGVAVAGDLPADLIQAITDAFLAIAETPEGQQALFDVYSIDGLVPADLEALDVARQVAANFGDR